MSGRGTNRGARTLSSRGRRSSGRGRVALHVAPILSPTIPPTQVPTNPSFSHVSPTPSPHINTTVSPSVSPSPTPSPTQTPSPSPILPQTSEETLPHTQSPAIESQEDQHVDQEYLPEIEPYGNEFNPSTAVRILTAAIKSKFDWFCPTWGHSNKDMRDLWFKEFKKNCRWKPKYDARIRQIFDIKGEARFRDKKFKNWSVANTTNRASSEGSSMHTGGSISMGEHARRMEADTQVKPSIEEVFAKCHLKKDNSWVDNRAENAMGEFKRRKTELSELSLSQNEDGDGLSCESQHMPDDLTIWKEVVPKGKKGTLYGLGSIGTNISSKYATNSCSIASKETNMEQELVKWQEKVKEQELINQEQKRQLEQQQKRIESTESLVVALFGKLNMPLPPNFVCATTMQDGSNETSEPFNGDNDDNFDVD